MKRITATLEVDMGVHDDSITKDTLLTIMRVTDRQTMTEAILQFVVKDVDTGLIEDVIDLTAGDNI